MPDIADARAAFQEAMRRAEVASGISRDADGNEVYAEAETPVATPELEGAVPVQASDQPLTPDPVALPEEQAPDTSGEQAAAPATEPSVEDLKAELAAAQARIEEQKLMIGRQSTEVGETREQIAELKSQIESVQAAQAHPQAATIQITQDLIDTNPAAAVQAAYDQRNEQALEVAFAAWRDPMSINGDPFAAATWLNDRKLEQQQKAFEEKLAAQEERIQKVSAPLAEHDEQKQWSQAFDEVKATRPDFIENAERLLTEVAPQYPLITNALSTGDAEEKAQALAALYALDKMGNPEAVQQQLAQAAQEAEAEAAAARTAAGAITGQSTAGQPAEQKTEEEQEQEQYLARQRSKPSLSRGWTGR